jgi:hypothetical protein
MLKREASVIVGGLSKTSKMPAMSYGLPAAECNVGRVLAKLEGSTCHGCYALKGQYRFPNVVEAQYRRLESLNDLRWVDAMVTLLKGEKYFRWHDSGDVRDQVHLDKIFQVCRRCPDTKFWMPTREAALIRRNRGYIPGNLTIRVSAAMVDGAPPKAFDNTSTVHFEEKAVGFTCPAPKQGGQCGDCRRCWSRRTKNVSYAKH